MAATAKYARNRGNISVLVFGTEASAHLSGDSLLQNKRNSNAMDAAQGINERFGVGLDGVAGLEIGLVKVRIHECTVAFKLHAL